MPYGSWTGYITLQKKVLKLSVPLLAKAKLTIGSGFNRHTYKSVPNEIEITSSALGITSTASDMPTLDALVDFVKENTHNKNGFHIQTGIQFKLLMLDSFLYYRQVFVDDVILGGKGFGSLNLRLGMGF